MRKLWQHTIALSIPHIDMMTTVCCVWFDNSESLRRLAELEREQGILDANESLYKSMFGRLQSEEEKRLSNMTDAERAAHEQMVLRLALKKKRQEAKLAADANKVDTSRTDQKVPPHEIDVVLDEEHKLYTDEPMMKILEDSKDAQLAALMKDMGFTAKDIAALDIDIMAKLRELTQAEAAKFLAAQMAKADADARMAAALARRKV
jgi:hypothetical protein